MKMAEIEHNVAFLVTSLTSFLIKLYGRYLDNLLVSLSYIIPPFEKSETGDTQLSTRVFSLGVGIILNQLLIPQYMRVEGEFF